MYNWKHEVSKEWLLARREVLTASEARDLTAPAERFKKVKKPSLWTAPEFLGVIGEKFNENVDTCAPSPSAARGHIMEPYAVEEFNAYATNKGYKWPKMYHWDDAIIKNGTMGFSPDALDVEQSNKKEVVYDKITSFSMSDSDGYTYSLPKAMLEIKSYNDKNHMRCGFTRKTGLKERYQLAYTMCVCPTIIDAYLMFYNPNNKGYPIFIKHYTRNDLVKEIDKMNAVHDIYCWYLMELMNNPDFVAKSLYTEDTIWNTEQDKLRVSALTEEVK